MSTVQMTKRIAERTPRVRSRFIGSYYLLTILTGAFVVSFHGRLAFVVDVAVAVAYLAITALLYASSASANKGRQNTHKEHL